MRPNCKEIMQDSCVQITYIYSLTDIVCRLQILLLLAQLSWFQFLFFSSLIMVTQFLLTSNADALLILINADHHYSDWQLMIRRYDSLQCPHQPMMEIATAERKQFLNLLNNLNH